MRLKGNTTKKTICLVLYYLIAQYLPASHKFFNIGGSARNFLCKRIFQSCGEHINIERKAYFGNGSEIELGDYSGIGINAVIPSNSKIGNYVMMGPDCYVLECNHDFSRIDVPMQCQGYREKQQLIIKDDVWIGRNVLMTPGRIIKKGTIIAAGCVLSKNFPEYSIVGGNPSKLIGSRLENK